MKWCDDLPIVSLTRSAWFTPASIAHFLVFIFVTWGIEPYVKYPIIVATVIHLIEELLENYAVFSMEGIWSRLTQCTHENWLDLMDSDSIQNMLGDIISGLLGSFLAIYVLSRPSPSVIFISLLSTGMIYTRICKSLNLNKLVI